MDINDMIFKPGNIIAFFARGKSNFDKGTCTWLVTSIVSLFISNTDGPVISLILDRILASSPLQ